MVPGMCCETPNEDAIKCTRRVCYAGTDLADVSVYR